MSKPTTLAQRLDFRFAVKGEHDAKSLAAHLIWLSTPFLVEPLPDDQWQFTVAHDTVRRSLPPDSTDFITKIKAVMFVKTTSKDPKCP